MRLRCNTQPGCRHADVRDDGHCASGLLELARSEARQSEVSAQPIDTDGTAPRHPSYRCLQRNWSTRAQLKVYPIHCSDPKRGSADPEEPHANARVACQRRACYTGGCDAVNSGRTNSRPKTEFDLNSDAA